MVSVRVIGDPHERITGGGGGAPVDRHSPVRCSLVMDSTPPHPGSRSQNDALDSPREEVTEPTGASSIPVRHGLYSRFTIVSITIFGAMWER